jgi:hypothetical protein
MPQRTGVAMSKPPETTQQPTDQNLADLFFWKVDQLKPIPARLA